ncbi:hypothetical protein ACNKHX_00705 [Shigella flexneri]
MREAIQRLEAKGLLLRAPGWRHFCARAAYRQSFSNPLVELLSDHPESQYDLLETDTHGRYRRLLRRAA